MKRLIFLSIFTLAAIFGGLYSVTIVHAADPVKNNIIDDVVFDNESSMNEGQIQAFINSFPNSCLKSQNQFSGLSPVAFRTPINYWSYESSDSSPAHIIYWAAHYYHLNPQVILATLEKEQSLVSGSNGCAAWKFNSAMGYNCPDTLTLNNYPNLGITQTCVEREGNAGFNRQVSHATWQLRFDKERAYGNLSWGGDGNVYYGGRMTQGSRSRQIGLPTYSYDGNTIIDGETIHLDNGATAALYNYTPHFSNFYNIFTRWFGSTRGTPTYGYSLSSLESYSDSNYTNKLANTSDIQHDSYICVKLSIKNTGNQVWRKETLRIGGQSPQDRSSLFSTDGWISTNRITSMNEDTVMQGETATFNFKMKAPQHLGVYNESFGILIEGNRWLDGSFSIPTTITSSSPYYSTQNISFETYSDSAMSKKIDNTNISKYTGSKIYVKTVIKNTGNQTFPANLTKIAPSDPTDRVSPYADSTWQTQSRIGNAQEGIIQPQGIGTFIFSMTAPDTPQTRTHEQFGLLIEGNRWLNFNLGGLSIQTNKRPPSELTSNQKLEIGESLLSYDERYKLILQGDGNLVLYSPTRALWSSSTVGKGGVRLIMQDDGNLVLYRSNWTAVWSSRTSGNGSSRLIPQTDGNLVIYNTNWRPSWSTTTSGQN